MFVFAPGDRLETDEAACEQMFRSKVLASPQYQVISQVFPDKNDRRCLVDCLVGYNKVMIKSEALAKAIVTITRWSIKSLLDKVPGLSYEEILAIDERIQQCHDAMWQEHRKVVYKLRQQIDKEPLKHLMELRHNEARVKIRAAIDNMIHRCKLIYHCCVKFCEEDRQKLDQILEQYGFVLKSLIMMIEEKMDELNAEATQGTNIMYVVFVSEMMFLAKCDGNDTLVTLTHTKIE